MGDHADTDGGVGGGGMARSAGAHVPFLQAAPGLPPRTVLEPPTRLSSSVLWRLMDEFYSRQGASAWQNGVVPSFITSNMFIARTYAKLALAFWADAAAAGTLSRDASHPLYVPCHLYCVSTA